MTALLALIHRPTAMYVHHPGPVPFENSRCVCVCVTVGGGAIVELLLHPGLPAVC
mgnify:CR=1 FL=1